jgi:SAM-dependent methyltransferase
MAQETDPAGVREGVRKRYAERVLTVLDRPKGGCCGGGACDPISRDLYDRTQAGEVPDEAILASFGCGNPTALAELRPGETVLDLGSGGGIDVLLSARRVGPTGLAYGLDMTDEMLSLAERNRRDAGAENVRFLKGEIEAIPLPDRSVDVIVSNCVINLAADKAAVLREAFRVLRPGGRLAISDTVVQGSMSEDARRDADAWAACVSGALEEREYRHLLAAAGFQDIGMEVTRVLDLPEFAGRIEGRLVSAFVRARRPIGADARAPLATPETPE